MAETAPPVDRRALESLLAFWAEAGVDAMLAEAPVDRLAAPAPRAPPPAAFASPRPGHAAARDASSAVEGARTLAAEVHDLAGLFAAVERFEGCGVRFQGAARAVIARGPSEPWVVAVGDAPTPEDEAAGEPFRGPGGKLVEALADAAGLKDRVLWLNTVFWRTPGGGAPSALDQAACLPFVERAIALGRPRAVLALGGAAAKGLLRVEAPILKVRGRWMDWFGAHDGASAPALATLAPSFLLAQPLARRDAWADLLSLAERVGAPVRS